jgi:PAS domain S-box-containing protein
MSTTDPIKVLVVDDLPDKRLVYKTILEEPGQEIIAVESGSEALRRLLQDDFAVILMDVNMPIMDGFETAALIRARRRCAHTPIIFVTSHTDEVHALRGYATGGVDYVLTPVVPEILRTKVRVFVDLFRKTQLVRSQAEALRELQARQHQRELRETNERLDLALESGRMGAFEWDLGPRLANWTPMLETIFGFAPGQFTGLAADLRQRIHAEDRERVVGTLVRAAQGGQPFRIEHRIVRAGSEVAWVELRGKVFLPEASPGEPASGPRISGVCMDITDRKSAEADKWHLAAIVESSQDAIISKNLDGVIQSWNVGAERLFGYSAAEAIGKSVTMLIPKDRLAEEEWIRDHLRRGERVPTLETVRLTRWGRSIDVSLTISPIYDASGRVIGASKMARDITERRRVEAELARHRAHLEELVRERTAELQASHERLRLADRLASIGTLAAGLGHDMGNLLLPMQMRLGALERIELPAEARDDIAAIREACEYLKRLNRGLRLFALSPEDAHSSGERTDLASWWLEVGPFLRNALPRSIRFDGAITDDLPLVGISPHMLTQAVFNLVQNAGDAMRDLAEGRVTLRADRGPGPDSVTLQITDTGPGMSDEVRARCMEPFYTTKTRSISTGLGLALVRGAVHKAGGTIHVDSRQGAGTTFSLTFPVVHPPDAPAAGGAARSELAACVSLRDPRLAAYVASLLRSHQFNVVTGPWSDSSTVSLVVADDAASRLQELRTFLDADASRAALTIGAAIADEAPARLVALGANPTAVQIRAGLARLVSPIPENAIS